MCRRENDFWGLHGVSWVCFPTPPWVRKRQRKLTAVFKCCRKTLRYSFSSGAEGESHTKVIMLHPQSCSLGSDAKAETCSFQPHTCSCQKHYSCHPELYWTRFSWQKQPGKGRPMWKQLVHNPQVSTGALCIILDLSTFDLLDCDLACALWISPSSLMLGLLNTCALTLDCVWPMLVVSHPSCSSEPRHGTRKLTGGQNN